MYIESFGDVYVRRSRFVDNAATGFADGGGLEIRKFQHAVVEGCVFQSNQAGSGEGGAVGLSSAETARSEIIDSIVRCWTCLCVE